MTERAHSTAPQQRRIPQYLRTLRRREGLTQEELALASGVSQPHISHLELVVPLTRVRKATRNRLAKALHLTDPTLLRFGPDPQEQYARRRERQREKHRAELREYAAESLP